MDGIVRIADSNVQFSDASLAKLNDVLKEMPLVDSYDNNKIQEKKRIRLVPVMRINTETYTV